MTTRTPLHYALGATTADLTFDMILQAADQQVEETANLEWKSELPLTDSPSANQKQKGAEHYELAKDIAAMANSGGGMIVYGVSETPINNRNAAGDIVENLKVTSDDSKRMHQVAFSAIHPPVSGLDVRHLREGNAGDETRAVLALLIPDSLDAPHLVVGKGDGGYFQVPVRSGPDTFFMTEHQLAEAYRLREQRRREQQAELDDLYDRFVTSVGATGDAPIWVFAVARPLQPLKHPRAMQRDTADRIAGIAANISWVRSDWYWSAITEANMYAKLRLGLRMFHLTSAEPIKPEGFTPQARVEIHGDGSVAVGMTRDGLLHTEENQSGHVGVDEIEHIGLDLIALLLACNDVVGPISDYEVSLDISPKTTTFRHRDTMHENLYSPFDESQRIRGFQPVRGTIVTQLGRTQLLNSAFDLINDAMNQAGAHSRFTSAALEEQLP